MVGGLGSGMGANVETAVKAARQSGSEISVAVGGDKISQLEIRSVLYVGLKFENPLLQSCPPFLA